MAYDVSVRQTPEMERKGKPPGENLAGILLNPPGMPLRTCVVVIRHANDVAELPRQRSSKRLSQRKLHASGNLLERVKLRARAVAQQHGTGSKEAMRTEFRKAVVLAESGRYKEALHVMTGELMRRRLILGKSDIATVRATWRFSQILINLGHFRDAQEPWLQVWTPTLRHSKTPVCSGLCLARARQCVLLNSCRNGRLCQLRTVCWTSCAIYQD